MTAYKENKKLDNALSTTQKVFAGAAAVGVVAMLAHGGGAIDAAISRNQLDSDLNHLMTVNGYHEANYNHKSRQINALVQDYSMGIITREELTEKIKDNNLTELDFDTFAENFLAQDRYDEYIRLKGQFEDEKSSVTGNGRGALVNVAIALVAASGVTVTGAWIRHRRNKAKEAKELARENATQGDDLCD